MLKAIECFSRRSDLAPEAFLRHWREAHTNVVLKINGLRAYIQNPVIALPSLAQPADGFDGAVEVWFDSLAAMRAAAGEPYWDEVVADEERFIDRRSRRLVLAEAEPPPADAKPAAAKLLVLVGASADPARSQFRADVQRLAARLQDQGDGVSVVTDLPTLSSYAKPRQLLADAVVSVRCQSWEQAGEIVTQQLDELASLGAVTTLAVAERVVLS